MRLRIVIAGVLATANFHAAAGPVPVTFDYVASLAVKRAAAPFQPVASDLPPRLQNLTYSESQAIKFRQEYSVWRSENRPFLAEFFPRGGLFRDPVAMHEFGPAGVRDIPFDPKYFDASAVEQPLEFRPDTGYAGVKVLYHLNKPNAFDEVIAFLGASYFRAIGAGQKYGLSARGIAVDAALPDRTEEFPRFTDFWLGKPEPSAATMTIYALLDGPSVAGAYEFVVTPGKATLVDVRARLNFRAGGKLIGFAPLTSMFWYGENSDRPAGELRPEVHDSDGLQVKGVGVPGVWQPLHNPTEREATLIPVHALERFGLLQRDRNNGDYEDLEAHYVQRPSAWIEPQGTWDGVVHLAESPATHEYGDNVVAYWVPASPASGQTEEIRYRIVWTQAEPPRDGLAKVVATREGPLPHVERGRLFWIDFADERQVKRDQASVDAVIEVGPGGKLRHHAVSAYPQIKGWRVAVEVDAERAGDPVALRCHLREGSEQISESWWYSWRP